MTAPIDAVFLDFAGTLFSDRSLRDVHLRQLKFVAAAAGREGSDQELRSAYRTGMGVGFRSVANGPFYAHRTLFAAAFTAMAEALGGHISAETADAAVDLQYQATIDAAELRPDCVATLVALREAGVYLQIVSNIDQEQLAGLVDRLGLAGLVDEATSSEAAGSCKPHPGIYKFALAKAGREPATVLFVGDSLSHDVEGPAAMGMRTAWLSIDAKPGVVDARPDYVIDALGESRAGSAVRRAVAMSDPTDVLEAYLDDQLGSPVPAEVTPMVGGGSCEIFSIDRGDSRWVLRRAPRHASSATAHDVMREFRILDAIKDTPVPIANPILACDDPAVFGSPFYVMERVDGVPIRAGVPAAWAEFPQTHGQALEEHIDALVAIHAVDWKACGLEDLAHTDNYLQRQIGRWLRQLDSYESRELAIARSLAEWMEEHRPAAQSPTLFHGDYKLDNVLYSPTAPPHLLAVVDWEMAGIGDPLVDLAWTLIFHPGPEGTMRLGTSREPVFHQEGLPGRAALVERYAAKSGRDTSALHWYDVFSRWKLAIALEGSYAKFLQGRSDKPIHEYFGSQADLLLASAQSIVERGTQ